MVISPPDIVRANNDLLYGRDRRPYIDLFTANGTTWLGHCDSTIGEAISKTLEHANGFNQAANSSLQDSLASLNSFWPSTHELAGLYSTGMEAAEAALQLTRALTKRKCAVGFQGSMHGKSLCTSYLGWDNHDGISLPDVIRLPFVSDCDEAVLLSKLETVLKSRKVAALFIEPLQGSGGGYQASRSYHRQTADLCERFGTLLVFDEILTGFHRTGPAFMFESLGVIPDILLIGKALGNGFPVSGIVTRSEFRRDPADTPTTPPLNHPLAIAAAGAVARRILSLDLKAQVAEIERIIRDMLTPKQGFSHQLRGKGAIWIIEPKNREDSPLHYLRLLDRGVAVGCGGGYLRLLPPATIDLDRLADACDIIREELRGRTKNTQVTPNRVTRTHTSDVPMTLSRSVGTPSTSFSMRAGHRENTMRAAKAENDLIFDENGNGFIDLFCGNGTTWLGHCHPSVTSAIKSQLDSIWISGVLDTQARIDAKCLVEGLFPSSHELAGFYTTGMEAAEFAIRLARVSTKRNGVAGFERSMHGKSTATAYLGWDNRDGIAIPGFIRLPFVPQSEEETILELLEDLLKKEKTSCVFIEPIQGYGGGYRASDDFYHGVAKLCAETGTLVVLDEVLTGLYRLGTPFFFSSLNFVPDIVLLGKSLGNGFPVSAVAVNRDYPVTKSMLPGSTFSGNALACAAVRGTLEAMAELDMPRLVKAIEAQIIEMFSHLNSRGVKLRGAGALWALEVPQIMHAAEIAARIAERGVYVSHSGSILRLMPPATIAPERLEKACNAIVDAILSA